MSSVLSIVTSIRQRDEERCEEWRRFLPIGLENIDDAEVDEQFVFPVCSGRDAAHPGREEKIAAVSIPAL